MTRWNSWDTQVSLLACVLAGVTNDGDHPITRSCVVPGEVAWDDCQCGQLTVSEVRRYPSMAFPLDQIDHDSECGAPYLVVELAVTLVRCVPSPEEDGSPPLCADLQAAANLLNDDLGRVRVAADCCLTTAFDADEIVAFTLGQQIPLGPQGGCAGSVLTVLVGFPNGCGCG